MLLEIVEIVGSVMTVSAQREFGVDSWRMRGAMTVAALWGGLMLVLVAFDTVETVMFGFARHKQLICIVMASGAEGVPG